VETIISLVLLLVLNPFSPSLAPSKDSGMLSANPYGDTSPPPMCNPNAQNCQ